MCWSPELSIFVAGAYNGPSGYFFLTSPDGNTWTQRVSTADTLWTSVCWSSDLSLFVAVAPPAATQSVPRLRGARARDFTISVGALSTWSIQPKPVSRLMGAPLLVAADDACAFWRRATLGVRIDGDSLVFPSDDACEEFFCTYFPNDIPDEWSVKERAKSHGLPAPPQPTQKNPWIPAFLLC